MLWVLHMSLRVRVEYDESPDYSYLEQWDTPDKYYGDSPDCQCGCGMDYHHDHSWQCSDNREEYNGDCDAPLLEWQGDDKAESGVMMDGDRRIPYDFFFIY